MVFHEHVFPQEFSLPKPIINYLINKVCVETTKKLQKSCRYFYSKFYYGIVDHFSISNNYKKPEFFNYGSQIKIPFSKTDLFKNNICLSKTLFILGSCRNNSLEKFFPKIVKCDIYQLEISFCENLTINDFAFLTKSGTLKHVEIFSYIYYPNGTKVPVEDLLAYIPNVYNFMNGEAVVTSDTMKKLFLLKRNVKFSTLALFRMNALLDIQLFFKYIQEMFIFDDSPSSQNQLSLSGLENLIRKLYEMFKTLGRKCNYFWDYDDPDDELRHLHIL